MAIGRKQLFSSVRRMADTIWQQKKALRAAQKERLRGVDEASLREQSELVTKKAVALNEYKDARAISIFLSMPMRELSTTEIALQALQDGKKVFIPYIHASSDGSSSKVMSMLRLRDEADLHSLQPDAWGIPSISPQSALERENALGSREAGVPCTPLDIVFMPAMAFDHSQHRLGHGKGFYDRYLAQLREVTDSHGLAFPKLIGLALREQILPVGQEVPTTDEDWQVDQVLVAG